MSEKCRMDFRLSAAQALFMTLCKGSELFQAGFFQWLLMKEGALSVAITIAQPSSSPFNFDTSPSFAGTSAACECQSLKLASVVASQDTCSCGAAASSHPSRFIFAIKFPAQWFHFHLFLIVKAGECQSLCQTTAPRSFFVVCLVFFPQTGKPGGQIRLTAITGVQGRGGISKPSAIFAPVLLLGFPQLEKIFYYTCTSYLPVAYPASPRNNEVQNTVRFDDSLRSCLAGVWTENSSNWYSEWLLPHLETISLLAVTFVI